MTDYNNILVDYSNETKSFGKSILNFLSEKYGEIPQIFLHSIHVLLTNHQIWSEARLDVLQRGALITVGAEVKKNPSFKILNDSQIFLNNQLKSWGLDPKSLKQLDSIEVNTNKQEDLMSVLSELEQ